MAEMMREAGERKELRKLTEWVWFLLKKIDSEAEAPEQSCNEVNEFWFSLEIVIFAVNDKNDQKPITLDVLCLKKYKLFLTIISRNFLRKPEVMFWKWDDK